MICLLYTSCHFQDQGGITIGDGVLIGGHVELATLNHEQTPAACGDMLPAPIHIGQRVWIGAHATILPGDVYKRQSLFRDEGPTTPTP